MTLRTIPLILLALCPVAAQERAFRPPAVPLIAHDPYFSVWSMADQLNAENTKHWTGVEQPLTSLVRVDGQTLRLMGRDPRALAALPQKSVEVLPTRTIYEFEGSGIAVNLTFLTPALPHDPDVLSRPLSYLIWTVRATDGATHDVQLYFDASATLAVNTGDQAVVWSRFRLSGMDAMRLGSLQQPVLEKDGDNLRIDWGYLYLSAPPEMHAEQTAASLAAMRTSFTGGGKLPSADDTETGRAATGAGLGIVFPIGTVGAQPIARRLMLAYDDMW
ncbi:MAG: DUF5127 domain-containing protein, partial [Acidobacteriota bacterium]|nr:DUF5127 domain-containing protein [Acidobacteriota bacterium]